MRPSSELEQQNSRVLLGNRILNGIQKRVIVHRIFIKRHDRRRSEIDVIHIATIAPHHQSPRVGDE